MENSNNAGGLGLITVIFIIFIILKLTNLIDWSWVWVLSPLWIPYGLGILIIIILRIIFRK